MPANRSSLRPSLEKKWVLICLRHSFLRGDSLAQTLDLFSLLRAKHRRKLREKSVCHSTTTLWVKSMRRRSKRRLRDLKRTPRFNSRPSQVLEAWTQSKFVAVWWKITKEWIRTQTQLTIYLESSRIRTNPARASNLGSSNRQIRFSSMREPIWRESRRETSYLDRGLLSTPLRMRLIIISWMQWPLSRFRGM
jgi:hypothetical protein